MASQELKKDKRKNGEGTFYTLPSGKVGYRKMAGRHDDGKPRYLSVSGTSETDCLKKMREREREDEKNPYRKFRKRARQNYGELTVEELCRLHLEEDSKNPRKELKPTSADRRRCTIDNQIVGYRISSINIRRLKANDVEEHIDQLLEAGLSPSTVEKTFHVINGSFKWALKKRMIELNPCDEIADDLMLSFKRLQKRDSAAGVIRVLSPGEEKRVVEAARLEWGNGKRRFNAGDAAIFLNETSIRCGEICALRLRHWNRKNHTIDIEITRHLIRNPDEKSTKHFIPHEDILKNAHRRTLQLSDTAQEVLEAIIARRPKMGPDDYFFLNRSGKPTDPGKMGSCFNRIFAAAGLATTGCEDGIDDVSGAHVFRRTYATRKYKEGCSVEDIAAYLGDDIGTVIKHYIDRTEKIVDGDGVQNVVMIPKKR